MLLGYGAYLAGPGRGFGFWIYGSRFTWLLDEGGLKRSGA